MTARRFVPFGTHWAMGIAVPYSFGVIDGGQLWSCGQCPLDLQAQVRAPGDLEAQLKIVAGYIREQFTPFGVPPSHIAKLVAYIVGDEADLALTSRVLSDALDSYPLVVSVGVPHFYYPGMCVEIDVYGAVGSAVSDLEHRVVGANDIATHSATDLLSTRIYVAQDTATDDVLRAAGLLGHDAGAAIRATLPADSRIRADLVKARGARARAETVDTGMGVRVTTRQAGRYLSLLGRSTRPGRSMPDSTQDIMEALAASLHAEGLDFKDVVKQQTHYVGSSAAEDLYANMRIRNSYYAKPGPASTGLAVFGFADPETKITIELLAVKGS